MWRASVRSSIPTISYIPDNSARRPTPGGYHERRSATIEIVIGAIKVRVPGGAEARDVEAVLRAVRRSSA